MVMNIYYIILDIFALHSIYSQLKIVVKLMMIFIVVVVWMGKKHICSLSQSDKSFPKRIGPLTKTKPKPPGL